MLCRQHVSDEEFLVLGENYESKNPAFPRDSYDPLALKNMRAAAECKAEFRVEKKKRSPQACRSLANSKNIKMLPRNRILSLVLMNSYISIVCFSSLFSLEYRINERH